MALLMKPEPFSNEANRLLNALLGDEDVRQSQRWAPAMDLIEAEDHFVLKADLPGIDESDVAIEIRDNTLRLSGERKMEHTANERGWYRLERACGEFSRSLTLPDGVEADAITASFDKGVLHIRIPKPEERKPRRVEIGVGQENDRQSAQIEGTATEG